MAYGTCDCDCFPEIGVSSQGVCELQGGVAPGQLRDSGPLDSQVSDLLARRSEVKLANIADRVPRSDAGRGVADREGLSLPGTKRVAGRSHDREWCRHGVDESDRAGHRARACVREHERRVLDLPGVQRPDGQVRRRDLAGRTAADGVRSARPAAGSLRETAEGRSRSSSPRESPWIQAASGWLAGSPEPSGWLRGGSNAARFGGHRAAEPASAQFCKRAHPTSTILTQAESPVNPEFHAARAALP